MAAMSGNGLFPIARNGFLTGVFDWDSDVWFCCFVDHADDVPQDDDDYMDDILAAARIKSATESSNRIANPVATDGDGVADGDNVTMSSVSGDQAESLLVAREVGGDQTTPANDELVVFIDTATGLPVTPNSGDITITWDSGANKIFKL